MIKSILSTNQLTIKVNLEKIKRTIMLGHYCLQYFLFSRFEKHISKLHITSGVLLYIFFAIGDQKFLERILQYICQKKNVKMVPVYLHKTTHNEKKND